jgi:CBS domain-containing protein
MNIKEIMSKNVEIVVPDTLLAEVAKKNAGQRLRKRPSRQG